jgi:hypothetical protein
LKTGGRKEDGNRGGRKADRIKFRRKAKSGRILRLSKTNISANQIRITNPNCQSSIFSN